MSRGHVLFVSATVLLWGSVMWHNLTHIFMQTCCVHVTGSRHVQCVCTCVQDMECLANEAAAATQQEADTILAQLEQGQITLPQARSSVKKLQSRIPGGVEAATMLWGLQSSGASAANVSGAGVADSGYTDGKEWLPAKGEQVRVLRMGGALGEVRQLCAMACIVHAITASVHHEA